MKETPTADTICAPATAPGQAAIAVVRLSGPQAFEVARKLFVPVNPRVSLKNVESHKMMLGQITDGQQAIDQVLLVHFIAPNSYTGEDVVEISTHGSPYIQERLIQLLLDQGARMANPGEFTLRAFLNGRMDLSQAEAVADLIASNSRASHQLAFNQMRGHFSSRIRELRARLLEFAGLIELELDFSGEDVEFADRSQLLALLQEVEAETGQLRDSFRLGNVLKGGIPVAIIGEPNVGKSTLLNAILNEEKAIVSEIPGTTRDVIEDVIHLEGVGFRFIDTAGLRESTDRIESVGVERTRQKIRQASVILYLFDISQTSLDEIRETISVFRQELGDETKRIILIANKIDLMEEIPHHFRNLVEMETLFISAKRKENIHLILESLVESVKGVPEEANQALVTNNRHYEALSQTALSVEALKKGINEGLSGDLLSVDLRTALYHLGAITGEVTTDEILGEIFSKFCIGK